MCNTHILIVEELNLKPNYSQIYFLYETMTRNLGQAYQ